MQIANNNYTNWKAIVLSFLATNSDDIFYRVDTSIGKVVEAWAVLGTAFVCYGAFENQGPVTATFTTDWTAAKSITTTIGITES